MQQVVFFVRGEMIVNVLEDLEIVSMRFLAFLSSWVIMSWIVFFLVASSFARIRWSLNWTLEIF